MVIAKAISAARDRRHGSRPQERLPDTELATALELAERLRVAVAALTTRSSRRPSDT
jgi:hypothetical protein